MFELVTRIKNAVFITGACRGTGYRIAEVFAQNGWSVIVTGRNGKDAYEAAEKLALLGLIDGIENNYPRKKPENDGKMRTYICIIRCFTPV